MKTYSAKPNEIERRWYVVDADGEVLGRMATRIASVLRGKHKPTFTPHIDTGDFVVVVNAAKVRLTGDKLNKKMYHRHSGYPGGLTSIPYEKLLRTHPERAVERAVRGMLPKTSLGRDQFRKLKVYPGAEHPHGAQSPKSLAEGLSAPAGFAPVVERKRKERPKKAPPAKKAAPSKKPEKAEKAPSKKKPSARKAPARKKKKEE